MRQCYITDLKPSMILGQSLFGYYGGRRTLLLGRGAEITAMIVQKLQSAGYPYVYIEEAGTENVFPEDVLSDATRDMSMLAISTYYEGTKNLIIELDQKSKQPVDVIKNENIYISPFASTPLRNCVNEIFQDLFNLDTVIRYKTISGLSRTNAIHSHVLNVTVLSLLLGDMFHYVASEQDELGLSAILHDIGKAALPDIYEKQYWELSAEETAMMRKHPEVGEKILRRSRTLSESVRQSVIQHHERQDGTGFPFMLKGDNTQPVRTHYSKANHIFRFAEIISVADAFDNLINGNFYNHRFSPKEALDELSKEAGTGLNSQIVRMLSSIVTLFPVGSNVKVINHANQNLLGMEGVVSKSDTQDSDFLEIIILFDKNKKRVKSFTENMHIDHIQLL